MGEKYHVFKCNGEGVPDIVNFVDMGDSIFVDMDEYFC